MTSTPTYPIQSHNNTSQTSVKSIQTNSTQSPNLPNLGIQPNGHSSTTEGRYPSSPSRTVVTTVPQIKLEPSPSIPNSLLSTPRPIPDRFKPVPKTTTTPSFPAPRSPLAQGTAGSSAPSGTAPHVPTTAPRGFPGQVDAVPGPSTSRSDQETSSRKRKWDAQGYNQMEQQHMEQRSNELHLALLLDQEETINASATKFTSYKDMVDRLLPWHVWQIHDEELGLGKRGKGKGAEDVEAAEIAEAAGLVARVKRIQERFGHTRRREGNPSRPSFDLLSLINMTKDSTTLIRGELPHFQSRQSVLENSLQGIQEQARRKEAEQRRVEEEKLKQIRKAKLAEEERIRADVQAILADERKAKEAKQAEEDKIRLAKEKEDKARQVAERAARGRGRPRGSRGRGRGGTSAPGLREAVLTQQNNSTPSSPAPLISPRPATPSPQPLTPNNGSSTPSTPVRPPPNGDNNGNGTITPVLSHRRPHPSTAHLGTITLVVKLNVLPQLVKLGLITVPQPTGEQANTYPAVIRGPVPGSTTGDLYLQVRMNMCSPFQMHGLAKALNIAIPASAYRALANSGAGSSTPTGTSPPTPIPGTPATAPAPASAAAIPSAPVSAQAQAPVAATATSTAAAAPVARQPLPTSAPSSAVLPSTSTADVADPSESGATGEPDEEMAEDEYPGMMIDVFVD